MRLETVYLEVPAAQLAEVAAFYGEVLGLAVQSELPGESVWFEAGGGLRLGFHAGASGAAPVGVVNLSFEVPDCDAEAARLRAAGVEVGESWDAPWGMRVALLLDPAGHRLWLSTPLAS